MIPSTLERPYHLPPPPAYEDVSFSDIGRKPGQTPSECSAPVFFRAVWRVSKKNRTPSTSFGDFIKKPNKEYSVKIFQTDTHGTAQSPGQRPLYTVSANSELTEFWTCDYDTEASVPEWPCQPAASKQQVLFAASDVKRFDFTIYKRKSQGRMAPKAACKVPVELVGKAEGVMHFRINYRGADILLVTRDEDERVDVKLNNTVVACMRHPETNSPLRFLEKRSVSEIMVFMKKIKCFIDAHKKTNLNRQPLDCLLPTEEEEGVAEAFSNPSRVFADDCARIAPALNCDSEELFDIIIALLFVGDERSRFSSVKGLNRAFAVILFLSVVLIAGVLLQFLG